MNTTLFVGDCTEDLATQAKSFDPSAYLVDSSNYKKFLKENNQNVTAYTSAADLPKIARDEAVFYQVLQKADQIYYCPPTTWSDHSNEFTTQNMKQITEYFLYLIHSEKNNVQGLDLSNYLNDCYLRLQDKRKPNNQAQLWIAGCSVTAGVGVDYHEKFAVLIAENFGGQFVDLSRTGASLEFSADQILRSDLRQGDVVIWGLTSEYRAIIWNRKKMRSENLNPYGFDYKNTNKADDIVDETRVFKGAISYAQVENFCQKIGAQLVAIPILTTETLQLILHKHKCYYQIPYMPIGHLDYGTDGVHPGPRHHQWYADQINKIIKENGIRLAT